MRSKTTTLAIVLLALLLNISGCATQPTPADIAFAAVAQKTHSALAPEPVTSDWWMPRHEAVNKRVAQGNVDLLLIGDSITVVTTTGGLASAATKSLAAFNCVSGTQLPGMHYLKSVYTLDRFVLVAVDSLESVLTSELAGRTNKTVVIAPDDAVVLGLVVEVLDIAKASGAESLAMLNRIGS